MSEASGKPVTRREALQWLAAAGAGVAAACSTRAPSDAVGDTTRAPTRDTHAMPPGAAPGATPVVDPVLASAPLGFQWRTRDPFLFCVHHDDRYPAGDEWMGPVASLEGRNLGSDFEPKDGWRMYHGRVVPGFPRHPHRGFETVTVVRTGLLDHSDSIGGTARYGGGDVQWLTAGDGIQHAEMFPLVERASPNPLELFQIWLNLPSALKRVPPHFSMLWSHAIPSRVERDAQGRETRVTVVAGRYGDAAPPDPPPNSWAAQAEDNVAIWTIKLAPGARFTLPAAEPGLNRTLYAFLGDGFRANERTLPGGHQFDVRADLAIAIENGPAETEMLLLQGRPIGEPVAQHGPFVMNTREELEQAYTDFRRTGFGGWPWPADDHVHAREEGRFAKHPDGRLERPA